VSVELKKMHSGDSLVKTGRLATALVVLCCCALASMAVQAQTGNDEKKTDAALELKLSSYETRVCPNSSLTLSLEVTNTGRRQVKISRLNLWSYIMSSRVGSEINRSSISCSAIDPKTDIWIAIEPGETFNDTRIYRLDADSFFQDAGRYKLSTSLQFFVDNKYVKTVASNEAGFEVYDCGAK
jgi:hypothetical protein